MGLSRQEKHRSHLPVLELLFKYADIKSVFEYGSGVYSTKFFVDHAQSVTSVEMSSARWYERVKKEIVSDKLKLLCLMENTDAIKYFNTTNIKYDLVFVDGSLRLECVQDTLGKTDLLVVHDLGMREFKKRRSKWNCLSVPDNYNVIVMKIAYPSTTIYICNNLLFNRLKEHDHIIIKG